MRDTIICEPLRTPVGRAGGMFKSLAHGLGATVAEALLARTRLPPEAVDDVPSGNAVEHGPRSVAWSVSTLASPALAGLAARSPQARPQAVVTTNEGIWRLRFCSPGDLAFLLEHHLMEARVRWGIGNDQSLHFQDSLARGRVTAGGKRFPVPGGMIETAENLRRDYKIGRLEQDEFSVRSHQRAIAAQKSGVLNDEIVPVVVKSKKGEETIQVDEHPRADTRRGDSRQAPPIRLGADPEATVTPATRARTTRLGLYRHHARERRPLRPRPLARLKSWSVAGVAPNVSGHRPGARDGQGARQRRPYVEGHRLIRIERTFASQVLACTREWKFVPSDFDRMNVHGSGISLATPSARPAAASLPRCCARWIGAARAMGSKPCASGAARASPRY
jgi:acetyl-CoA C-acetyltransferase